MGNIFQKLKKWSVPNSQVGKRNVVTSFLTRITTKRSMGTLRRILALVLRSACVPGRKRLKCTSVSPIRPRMDSKVNLLKSATLSKLESSHRVSCDRTNNNNNNDVIIITILIKLVTIIVTIIIQEGYIKNIIIIIRLYN